jgi:hypothetical protein
MREYSIAKPNMWKRSYEISNERGWNIGHVNWKGAFTSQAQLVGKSNRWDISTNMWWTKLVISDKIGINVGFMSINGFSMKMTLNYKGEVFHFKNYNWTSSVYTWEDSRGFKMASFKAATFSHIKNSSIRVYGEMDNELRELWILLGWYLFVMKKQQQGGAA